MSLASSIPSIKIKVAPPPAHHHHHHHHNPCKFPSKPFTTIKSSKAEGPLRRPTAPSLSPPPPSPPSPPSSSSSPPPPPSPSPSLSPPPSISASPPVKPTSPSPPKPATTAAAAAKEVVTLEYQRKVAKELQDYFKQKKLEEEADQGPFFGFTVKNEIANGRWAMFGFAVGLLTEYATGSDFVQQLKILFSNFGIVDLE